MLRAARGGAGPSLFHGHYSKRAPSCKVPQASGYDKIRNAFARGRPPHPSRAFAKNQANARVFGRAFRAAFAPFSRSYVALFLRLNSCFGSVILFIVEEAACFFHLFLACARRKGHRRARVPPGARFFFWLARNRGPRRPERAARRTNEIQQLHGSGNADRGAVRRGKAVRPPLSGRAQRQRPCARNTRTARSTGSAAKS